jgi:hypothetical protein
MGARKSGLTAPRRKRKTGIPRTRKKKVSVFLMILALARATQVSAISLSDDQKAFIKSYHSRFAQALIEGRDELFIEELVELMFGQFPSDSFHLIQDHELRVWFLEKIEVVRIFCSLRVV